MDLNIYFIGGNSYSGIKSATMQQCYAYLKDKKVISLDIETTQKFGGHYKGEGLDPYLSDVVMLQIGTKERQYVIDTRVKNISPLLPILTGSAVIVGQNIKFEYKHLLHKYKVRLNNLYDTMIVEQILFNGLNVKASLSVLNQKYLNVEVDKSTRLEFLSIGDKAFTTKQIYYGAEDVLYPLMIRDKQLEDVKRKEVHNCVSLEMKFIPVIGEIEYRGMHFNTTKWEILYKDNLLVSQNLKDTLNEYVTTNYQHTRFIKRQYELFDEEVKCDIQWSSPKQVIDFFKYLNICPQEVSKTTKKLSYTVNATVLTSSLNSSNSGCAEHLTTLIKTYLSYKASEQACNTFGIDFFKYINPVTKRLHSNYRQILNTGRISSSNPNLQNIPSDIRFREAFDSPPDYKIVNADYSGQETVCLVNTSMDKDLIKFFKSAESDMHAFVASKIYPELADTPLKEIKAMHPEKRQIAKAAGFALSYGGTGRTVAKNLGISDAKGESVYKAYFKAFPGLASYFTKVKKASLNKGFILIDDVTGRKRWFTPPTNKKEIGGVERASLNSPIQGQAGSITKYAAILFHNWILDNKLEAFVFISNIVHDEINVECHINYLSTVPKALEDCMRKAGSKWCKTIPLEAQAVVSDFWGH